MKLRLSRPTNPANVLQGLMMHADELERRISFGTATVSWPGGASKSNNTNVIHELDGVPHAVVVTLETSAGEGAGLSCNVRNLTATAFDVFAEYVTGFAPGAPNDRTAHWMAIR